MSHKEHKEDKENNWGALGTRLRWWDVKLAAARLLSTRAFGSPEISLSDSEFPSSSMFS
jgi:hypothetical protein